MIKMPFTQTTYTLNGRNRKAVRREVIELFLLEEPGTGKGEDCSKYLYTVESIDGYSILLKRPVPLNKGFDFTVNIEGLFFKKKRRYKSPRHYDIVSALNDVRNTNPSGYVHVKTALTQIYNCQPFNKNSLNGLFFSDYEGQQHPVEIILLAIKWLFIEQDMTYWNWSGRNMLWQYIKDI
jgi:hypothetical protein